MGKLVIGVADRFSFSLRTMLAGLTLAALAAWLLPKWIQRDSELEVNVAVISGDDATMQSVIRELALHGIESGCEGSVSQAVFVPARNAEAAKRVLRNAQHLRGIIRVAN